MKDLVFATNNKNKIKEITLLLAPQYNIRGLADIGCHEELPETSSTLEGNALQKAKYVYEKYGVDCFADDTGLEVKALGGRPGVYSARYAGEGKDANANMDKLLEELKGQADRSACFRTVIALLIGGEEHVFEGRVEGVILSEKSGAEGFGYDPVFVPEGGARSFAQMSIAEKNEVSHRSIAVRKLAAYLSKRN